MQQEQQQQEQQQQQQQEQQQQQQQQQQLIDISRLAATTGKMSCFHNFVIVTPSLASNWLHIIADAAAAPQLQVRSVKMQSPNHLDSSNT